MLHRSSLPQGSLASLAHLELEGGGFAFRAFLLLFVVALRIEDVDGGVARFGKNVPLGIFLGGRSFARSSVLLVHAFGWKCWGGEGENCGGEGAAYGFRGGGIGWRTKEIVVKNWNWVGGIHVGRDGDTNTVRGRGGLDFSCRFRDRVPDLDLHSNVSGGSSLDNVIINRRAAAKRIEVR